jgi:hypothetical protein
VVVLNPALPVPAVDLAARQPTLFFRGDRMHRKGMPKWSRMLLSAAVAATLMTQVGCVGLLTNLLYPGHLIPAAYDELKEQKVAVVCVSTDSIQSPYSTSTLLARKVQGMLQRKVKDIQLIDEDKVADWIDNNDWDQVDHGYREIGKGVGADKVVAVEVSSYSLHDGGTMFKGRCAVDVAVYDMVEGGKKVLILDSLPVVYPANGGLSTTTQSDREFRNDFLNVVAHEVAKNFYRHDLKEDMALDATHISHR